MRPSLERLSDLKAKGCALVGQRLTSPQNRRVDMGNRLVVIQKCCVFTSKVFVGFLNWLGGGQEMLIYHVPDLSGNRFEERAFVLSF